MPNLHQTLSRAETESWRMELRGVRVHNLKGIDLDIPLGQLVVVSGVSGSGKSSLAFETLFAEGQRRYLESFSIAARQRMERIERPDADRIAHVPVTVAIRSDHSRRVDLRSTVGTIADLLDGLRLLWTRVGHLHCPGCRCEIRAHSAADVVRQVVSLAPGTRCQIGFAISANSETDSHEIWLQRGFSRAIWGGQTMDLAAKPVWPSAGEVWIVVDRLVSGKTASERVLESAESSLREGGGRCWLVAESQVQHGPQSVMIDNRPWEMHRFSRRLECPTCEREFLPPQPRLFSHLSSGACVLCRGTGRDPAVGSGHQMCPACAGTRFREEARAVTVAGRSISDVCRLTPLGLIDYLDGLSVVLPAEELGQTDLIRADVRRRMQALIDLGLNYLTLDRLADSLSGGETRRLMLAGAIGSRLTGTLVIVDEPSAGLTVAEMPRVVAALRQIQSLRNSVIAVDHAPFVVAAADYVIELGPGAGPAGGNVVYHGSPAARTATAASDPPGRQHVPDAKTSKPCLRLSKIQHHNLLDRPVEFPLRQLCVVTGPSGSGKTSLVVQTLFPAVCQAIGLPCSVFPIGACEVTGADDLIDAVLVDQSPLTTSSRSNPATWLDVFDEIRQTFAATADAKQRGFTPQQFSFNSANGGRCRSCLGTGLLKQDMQFLPDVTQVCPECHGTRYRPEILDVKYRGRSIADVLAMSAFEAASFFRSQPRLQAKFQMLKQIGLDYLVLGQPSESLSGGEAQRLKLAARLAAPPRGPSLIVCDEPTSGLHPIDVARLVTCFRELLANGHSLVLADNSPELLAAAEVIIELPL